MCEQISVSWSCTTRRDQQQERQRTGILNETSSIVLAVTFEEFDLSYVDDPLGEKGDTVLEGARAEWKTGEGGSLFRIRVGRV
jgi:hypothetical protein